MVSPSNPMGGGPTNGARQHGRTADRGPTPGASRGIGSVRAAARRFVVIGLVAMLSLSVYGTMFPADVRCGLPGAVGCPGGLLGPAVIPAGSGDQWFDVTMYDWGFWIVDSTSGANVSGVWNVFEGWTVHVNATSLSPDAAIGGTAYHGLGIELNATGQQLMSLAAPVGQWVSASFVAPTTAYYHQHIWCTIQCGPGHGSQQEHNLNIIPAVPLPKATVSANTTLGAAPLMVSVSGNATSGTAPYNLSWNFGDGSPDEYGALAQHTYVLGGVYYATLVVTDAKGNQGRASATITVLSSSPLSAELTPLPSTGVAPFGTSLSAVVHGGTPPYAYSWSFGDGGGGAGANESYHVFTAAGVFASSVEITDASGKTLRTIASVVVRPASGSLTVSATANPSGGIPPLPTTLTASASGGTAPYNFTWIMGDGSSASGASISHQYNQTGSYIATVFASDRAGNGGFATVNVVVNVSSGGGGDDRPASVAPIATTPLTVRLLTTPSGGSPPLAIHAIASIENGSGLGESVAWKFGDGGTASGQVANHTFATPGSYTITAAVQDSTNGTGTATTPVVVGGAQMTLVVNATIGDSPFAVQAGTTLAGGSGTWGPASWSWGDGTSTTGYLADHLFDSNTSENLTVHASATDSAGDQVASSVVIDVTGAPTANLTVQLPSGTGLPAVVTMTLQVQGGSGGYPADALWAFGDQSSTRGPVVVTHSYNRTGHFLVTVETNDSSGRLAIASAWVNLSSAVGLPPLSRGTSVWVFTGVPNPQSAALVMMGLVAVTGLAFLVRRRRKRRGAAARSTGAASGSYPTSPVNQTPSTKRP